MHVFISKERSIYNELKSIFLSTELKNASYFANSICSRNNFFLVGSMIWSLMVNFFGTYVLLVLVCQCLFYVLKIICFFGSIRKKLCLHSNLIVHICFKGPILRRLDECVMKCSVGVKLSLMFNRPFKYLSMDFSKCVNIGEVISVNIMIWIICSISSRIGQTSERSCHGI